MKKCKRCNIEFEGHHNRIFCTHDCYLLDFLDNHRKPKPETAYINGEEWRDVVGHEGLYKISNCGRIKRCDIIKLSKKGVYYTSVGKMLKSTNMQGYRVTFLTKGSTCVCKRIARLVAEAFIPNPERKPQVNHIDMNRSNNHVSNLEWCTSKENINHAFKNNKNRQIVRGERARPAKLNESQVVDIFNHVKNGKNPKELSLIYGVLPCTILQISKRLSWKHLNLS
ncbi:MAG TPA: NUMOD4 domain-containing protein [Bacteroidia bacterium]|nr:NUMOD4 domain-containing protein [Bacteroidia bacterium]